MTSEVLVLWAHCEGQSLARHAIGLTTASLTAATAVQMPQLLHEVLARQGIAIAVISTCFYSPKTGQEMSGIILSGWMEHKKSTEITKQLLPGSPRYIPDTTTISLLSHYLGECSSLRICAAISKNMQNHNLSDLSCPPC